MTNYIKIKNIKYIDQIVNSKYLIGYETYLFLN